MKVQPLTAGQFGTPATPRHGDDAVMMLDENAVHLQLASEQPAADTSDAGIIFRPAAPVRRAPSFLKEAVALVALTVLFTVAFWVVLSYLHRH